MSIEIKYIRPFIETTIGTFEMMCGNISHRNGELSIHKSTPQSYEMIAEIEILGEINGKCLLTMDQDTACRCVSSFIGEDVSIDDRDVFDDAFGELINIIAGGLTSDYAALNITLGLPKVIEGIDKHPESKSPWVIIPMRFTEWGQYNLEVSIAKEN